MRRLLDYDDELTAIEITLAPGTNIQVFQKSIEETLGRKFQVKNRLQQQELLYKVLKTERWAIFFILTFILLIATFNVIGSLTMLILDKRKDIRILWSLGSSERQLKKIFVIEGSFVVIAGAFIGLMTGLVVCLLQQKFGLVRLGSSEGAFLVNAYPVSMRITDFVIVASTVLFIGFISALIPVRRISKHFVAKRIA
jgi:lipoprotein-releasing system permease protein